MSFELQVTSFQSKHGRKTVMARKTFWQGKTRNSKLDTMNKIPPKKIQLDRYKELRITWKDETQSVYPIRYLRQRCPCATCRELRSQNDPLRVLSNDMLVSDVHVVQMEPVGHYALGFHFSDGHATGIYSYDYLLDIARRSEGVEE